MFVFNKTPVLIRPSLLYLAVIVCIGNLKNGLRAVNTMAAPNEVDTPTQRAGTAISRTEAFVET